jgi:hypothetical protein
MIQLAWARRRARHPMLCMLVVQEVQVVFPVHLPPAQVEDAWVTLAHALGGLLCTSLHTLAHPSQTAQLRLTSMATSAACHSSLSSLHRADAGSTTTSSTSSTSSSRLGGSDRGGIQLAAALPQEAVCTENLTPWLKLLPCQDAAGLASLLNREAVLLAGGYGMRRAVYVLGVCQGRGC